MATTTQAPAAKKTVPKGRLEGGKVNSKVGSTNRKIRLYARAVVTGFKRSLRKQYTNTSILKIEGVNTQEDARFYLGKRVAYVTRPASAGTKVRGPKSYKGFRVQWGKVTKIHGNSGAVRARFGVGLPATSIGKYARVFLYPSNI